VDFIESRFRCNGDEPEVIVHVHCGESGAIGAALEAQRLWKHGRKTTFIGLDAVETVSYTATTSEDTRCHFCKNECLRTFIDVEAAGKIKREQGEVETASAAAGSRKSRVPLAPGARRLIVNNSCEKGLVEDVESMREIKKDLDARLKAAPNFVEKGARDVFKPVRPVSAADAPPRVTLTAAQKERAALVQKRENLRIGIPRMLNQYSTNPLFSGYFEALGVRPQNLVYSDYTTEELYKEGAKRGAIDPCFPSKLGIPHVHNLIFKHHEKKPLDAIFFPMIDEGGRPLRQEGDPLPVPGGERGAAAPVRAPDVRRVPGRARPLREGERPRGGSRLQGAGRVGRRHAPRGARGARSAGGGAKARHRGIGTAVPQRSRHQPRDPHRVPEARLPGLHAGFAPAR
jgi:hypothetical protein